MTTALDDLITRYEETTASTAPASRFELAELRRSLEAAEARAAQLEAERDYQMRRVESLQITINTIDNDNDKLQAERDEARRRLAEAQAKIAHMEETKRICDDLVLDASQMITELRNERDEARQQLAEAQAALSR